MTEQTHFLLDGERIAFADVRMIQHCQEVIKFTSIYDPDPNLIGKLQTMPSGVVTTKVTLKDGRRLSGRYEECND